MILHGHCIHQRPPGIINGFDWNTINGIDAISLVETKAREESGAGVAAGDDAHSTITLLCFLQLQPIDDVARFQKGILRSALRCSIVAIIISVSASSSMTSSSSLTSSTTLGHQIQRSPRPIPPRRHYIHPTILLQTIKQHVQRLTRTAADLVFVHGQHLASHAQVGVRRRVAERVNVIDGNGSLVLVASFDADAEFVVG
mmetsp:Transcript_41827/g.76447  ORF Transcript_41827/g.76447 Transcript_41827/m.76447 type:complete len:200 (-) Transcript_41827:313-912(-)